MKVVILAGGFGTRLGEETANIPKPMVRIGQHPMLWHIMKFYASYGFEEFVVALGYKAEVVKNFSCNLPTWRATSRSISPPEPWSGASATRSAGPFT